MNSKTAEHTPVSFTPGPWVFAYGSVYKGTFETLTDHNSLRIALMDRNEPQTQPTERDANARLIAAAPELLAACEAACRVAADCLPPSGEGELDPLYYKAKLLAIDEAASKCSAAILKAKGQQ